MQISGSGSKIYLFGGEGGPSGSHFGYGQPVDKSFFSLDLDSEEPLSWNRIDAETAPSPRLGHGQTIVRLPDGRTFLYVFGGRQPETALAKYDGTEKIRQLNDMHRLSLDDTGSGWEQVPCAGHVPGPRSYLSLVTLGTELFLFGGMVDDARYSDLYRFSPLESTWQRLPEGPMEGRGGAGVFANEKTRSVWVVGGFCGRPMSDVWEFRLDAMAWRERKDFALPGARSIYAGPVGMGESFLMFGGELANRGQAAYDEAGEYDHDVSGLYSSELLSLGEGSRVLATKGTAPTARAWTSGCGVEYAGKRCFALFGGIREGLKRRDAGATSDEPAGVRLGDLHVLVPSSGE